MSLARTVMTAGDHDELGHPSRVIHSGATVRLNHGHITSQMRKPVPNGLTMGASILQSGSTMYLFGVFAYLGQVAQQ